MPTQDTPDFLQEVWGVLRWRPVFKGLALELYAASVRLGLWSRDLLALLECGDRRSDVVGRGLFVPSCVVVDGAAVLKNTFLVDDEHLRGIGGFVELGDGAVCVQQNGVIDFLLFSPLLGLVSLDEVRGVDGHPHDIIPTHLSGVDHGVFFAVVVTLDVRTRWAGPFKDHNFSPHQRGQ